MPSKKTQNDSPVSQHAQHLKDKKKPKITLLQIMGLVIVVGIILTVIAHTLSH